MAEMVHAMLCMSYYNKEKPAEGRDAQAGGHVRVVLSHLYFWSQWDFSIETVHRFPEFCPRSSTSLYRREPLQDRVSDTYRASAGLSRPVKSTQGARGPQGAPLRHFMGFFHSFHADVLTSKLAFLSLWPGLPLTLERQSQPYRKGSGLPLEASATAQGTQVPAAPLAAAPGMAGLVLTSAGGPKVGGELGDMLLGLPLQAPILLPLAPKVPLPSHLSHVPYVLLCTEH